ncbi:hypothetical protein BAUCODRAFT_347303 [Baudoinia panamericana UAMH 10762]|uniref:Uncharacterized protein n=1 Tax=Baudoinia panamericana (strain UAMH 10762) TaxID=717646 RepID=M2NJU9_BAUPA|nr:uncharacterized protein BAUCODRAFT_347303 [Baudoinia panamericana UAMH 10762]EMC99699.1 hypothetical protein BAUCODRAFT_347303 [Baudoinia panamericana UAMH 10762]
MQGFNMGRYVPPDQEGTTSGNRLNRKRAPGTLRADGTQTVRFEMPFAVWCHTCQPHAIIGQGVRFNAEKKRAGKYYTTPIWSFRMRHPACGGFIVIQTDPKNTAYVVTEGGIPILTPAERERRREDAFAQLEGQVEEKLAVKDNTKRIEELYRARKRDWEDPFAANRRLRTEFRKESKKRKRDEEATQALKERLGTDMELLPETEEDARRAELVGFGVDDEVQEHDGHDEASRKALFDKSTASPLPRRSDKREEGRREALRRRLLANTRAASNPFSNTGPKAER